MIIRIYFLLFLAIFSLSGCSTIGGLFGDDEDDLELLDEELFVSEDISAQLLYQQANNLLAGNQFEDAIASYHLLESRYPFGKYAQQAQIELAYLYYKQSNTELAVASADRFLSLNPQHPNADYANYIKGLALFDSDKTFLNFVLPRDPSNKNSASLLQSFEVFNHLVKTYPDSEYAEDAKQRMIFLRNELAEYELVVADYYLRRGAYLAASNRAQYVVERYQGAPSMPQALYILEASYRQLGINDLADDIHTVYLTNYVAEDGTLLDPAFATTDVSCADSVMQRLLERLKFRTYYCN